MRIVRGFARVSLVAVSCGGMMVMCVMRGTFSLEGRWLLATIPGMLPRNAVTATATIRTLVISLILGLRSIGSMGVELRIC